VGGRIGFNGAIQLGNPYCADFPSQNLYRGAVLLALAVDRPCNLARAQVTGDVNVRALLKARRKFGDRPEAGDAMPVGVRLPLALGVFPRPLGGEREDGQRNTPAQVYCRALQFLPAAKFSTLPWSTRLTLLDVAAQFAPVWSCLSGQRGAQPTLH
jgi:hypothetical protein